MNLWVMQGGGDVISAVFGKGWCGTKEIEIDRSATIKTAKHSQSPPSRLGIVSES